jgi:predicted metal-dependent phosphoesterase TrpH
MHLLGYGFDPSSQPFRWLAGRLSAARAERAALIVERLARVGVDLSLDEVYAEAGGANVGRPHVAALLVRKGHALTTRDAFNRYLGGGGVAYVDTNPLDSAQVIDLIRQAGGLVSLAHPLQLRRRDFAQLEAIVRELAEQGMEGLETMHGSHETQTVHRLTRLADRLDLLTTGGSDFHGASKPWIRLGDAGRRHVPRAYWDAVVQRLGSRSKPAEREPREPIAAPRRAVGPDACRRAAAAVTMPAP